MVEENQRLKTAFYLQAAVLGKGYDDFGLCCPVGQDLGVFQCEERGGFVVCFEGYGIPIHQYGDPSWAFQGCFGD
jgi:hypothetical protein